MSNNFANADSLLYLQECINDLQNRFYGLQLEQLQKQEHQKMLSQIPSLSNSIWSTSQSGSSGSGPCRPPSASSSTSSATASESRDSGACSMRSFSPDVSATSMAQLNAAAALWPQAAQAAATAATLAAFMPKNGSLGMNAFSGLTHSDQMEEIFQAPKKVPSPIGTGKPKNNFNPSYNQHQFNQSSFIPTQFDNRHHNHQIANQQSPFSQFNRNQQRMKQMHAKKTHNSYGGQKMNQKMEKPKQGPFNKVLIVGLAPEYRSLNGVLDIFRPYGDVVSARVYRPFLTLPPEITRWVPSVEVQGAFCAIIEYPTARCAKFAVGVLRERVTTNKYRLFRKKQNYKLLFEYFSKFFSKSVFYTLTIVTFS